MLRAWEAVMHAARLLSLLAFALLAGCGTPDHRARRATDDPAMAEAVEGQLLVDPDLSQQNMRNYAVVPAGPVDPALPAPDPKD